MQTKRIGVSAPPQCVRTRATASSASRRTGSRPVTFKTIAGARAASAASTNFVVRWAAQVAIFTPNWTSPSELAATDARSGDGFSISNSRASICCRTSLNASRLSPSEDSGSGGLLWPMPRTSRSTSSRLCRSRVRTSSAYCRSPGRAIGVSVPSVCTRARIFRNSGLPSSSALTLGRTPAPTCSAGE